MKYKFKKNEGVQNCKTIKLYILFSFLLFLLNIKNKKLYEKNNKELHNSINDIIEPNNSCLSDFNSTLMNIEHNKTLIKKNGKKFIDKCLNRENTTKIFNFDSKPIISTIIPVYNAEKHIFNSICSIQNQDFINFEIVLVDDSSIDNSFKIIKGLQKFDKRIKILKNKKNMGSLYSRSIGILMSNGDFIFGLDNDDMFFSNDIYKFFLKFAQNYDFDIIGFRAFQTSNYKNNFEKITDLYDYKQYPKSIIIYQPQLSTWLISRNGKFFIHDMTVWAKCIKSKIYKEATIKLGEKRYSNFVSWGEDTIINFIIFNIAQSFIFIHKYGIIHLNNISTASYRMPKEIKLFGEIFFVDILYDFSKNNSDKNYAVFGAYNAKKNFKINQFDNSKNLIYFKFILIKILNSQYISIDNKIKIQKDFKSFFN